MAERREEKARHRKQSKGRKNTLQLCVEQQGEEFIKENLKKHGGEETDAYGEIEFPRNNTVPAKYVKVAEDTDVGDLYKLLIEHWGLKTPNLVISVTGGAKNFTMRPRLMEVFRKSLIKASESTGAWITTGGTHAGVMKHVGKAVKNYAAIKDEEDNKVATIGIASWGVIHQKKKLLDGNKSPRKYDAEESEQGGNTILDSNHSHFILVDSGIEGCRAYGKEIGLRTRLERHIAKQTKRDVHVMIVCVIVQGGPGSLETAARSIDYDTPVVIVEGSGGWADILATASKMKSRSIKEDMVKVWMQENNMDTSRNNLKGENNETNLEKWTKMVKTCLSKLNLLTVFSLDASDTSRDLDIAILEALLKARSIAGNENQQKSNEIAGENRENQREESAEYIERERRATKKKLQETRASETKQQLELAMLWNRSDIAKSHILDDDSSIKQEDIAKIFLNALEANKHKFCKVLLDYGVDLKKHCTVMKLERLYEYALKHSDLHGNYEKNGFSIKDVRGFMEDHLGDSYISVYEKTDNFSRKYSARNSTQGEEEDKLDDPYREVFQWAILMNYREIAKHVWEYMSESMSAAIMATKMLKTLAQKIPQDNEKQMSQMLDDADEYEKLAAGILDKCFLKDRVMAIELLTAILPKWGGYTCLQVAVEAEDMVNDGFDNEFAGMLGFQPGRQCGKGNNK